MTTTATTITVDSLPIANTIDPVQDRLLIYTNSALDIQGINRNVLLGLSSQPVGINDLQILTNKTVTNPILNTPTISTPTVTGGMNITSGTLTVTGNETIGGTLIVTGVITPTGGLSANSVNAAALATTALGRIYPIGCIYTETTGSNPNTTFGFGTWVAFGGGRVLIGNGTSDQTFTSGTTGGESNHTLTTNELASHSHGQVIDSSYNAGSGGSPTHYAQNNTGANTAGSGFATLATGGGIGHNNLPSYIVVYFWNRTA